jgi:septal ring factor EnvC (AmiA/AmiB activator)
MMAGNRHRNVVRDGRRASRTKLSSLAPAVPYGRVAAIIGAMFVWSPAVGAQDIRGLEVCTAEKQMDRRTGCLQANVEFLQQTLNRTTRETQAKLAAAARDIAAAQAEITALRATMTKLQTEIAALRKSAPADKNTGDSKSNGK